MKLQTLEIQRFGKFENKTISLSDGLFLWSDANESGKTTTADFIRFIFYGFEKSRARRALSDNPLEKYQPWDSDGTMAGAIEFTDENGNFFRIERTQQANGRGQVRVLDASGNESDVAVPGEHFFGIDAETFANIYYIRQGENAPHRTAGMDVAMKNLMMTGSEEISFDSVMKFLQAEKAKYSSPKRQMGKLKNLQQELGELERSIAYKTADLAEQKRLLSDPVLLEQQIAEFDKQIKQLGLEKQKEKAYKAFLRQQKRAELKEQHTEILRRLAEDCPSDEETGLLYEILEQLQRVSVQKEQAQKHLEQLKQTQVHLGEREQTILEYQGGLKDTPAKVLLGIGALLAAAGAVATLWSLWSAVLCGIGVALLTGGMFGMRLPSPLRALGIKNKGQFLSALTDAVAAKQAVLSYQNALESATKTLENYQKQENELKEKYQPILERTGVFSLSELETVQSRQIGRKLLVEKREEIEKQLDRLAETQAEDALIADKTPPAESAERMEEVLRQKTEQKEKALRKLADNAALASLVAAKEDALRAEKEKRAEINAEYEKCDYLNDVAGIAIDVMQLAQQKLRENYAPALREKVEQNLGALTDGKYDTVMLDEQFSLRIKADGGFRALDYFSCGTKDAAFLALRLALAEIVESGRTIPMIFDDPFLNFDSARLLSLKACLQKLSEKRQILLFSCRDF